MQDKNWYDYRNEWSYFFFFFLLAIGADDSYMKTWIV